MCHEAEPNGNGCQNLFLQKHHFQTEQQNWCSTSRHGGHQAKETNDIERSWSSFITFPALGVLLRVYSLTKTVSICIFHYIILFLRVSSHHIHACTLFWSTEVMKGDLKTPISAQQALLSHQHYSNEHFQLPPLHQPFCLEIWWKVLQQLFHWGIRVTFETLK